VSRDLILASGNSHKAEEFSELFDSNILNIKAAQKKLDVVEDGLTFRENALKKGVAYYNEFQLPVMADDSGLVIEALPDQLGIHTARFGGEGLSARQRNELLIKTMSEIEELEKRAAYFICVLCFYLNESEVFFFEGRVDGHISFELSGDQGFGYDPVFLPVNGPEGLSLAEVPEWKNEHSHRAVACQHAQKFFKERVGQN
jgi:XTP/dITP diphosphohydrolase